MAKETEERQTSEETQDPVKVLTQSLQTLLKNGGLTITIDGEERPYSLVGGNITNVVVGSAWIGFTRDECAFRTKDSEDRKAFLALLEKGCGDARNIRFTKNGVLLRPVVAKEEKKKLPFMPRGRHAYGRPKLLNVSDRYALTED